MQAQRYVLHVNGVEVEEHLKCQKYSTAMVFDVYKP